MRFEEGKFQCTYEEGKFQCTYIIPAGLKAFNLLYSLELQLFHERCSFSPPRLPPCGVPRYMGRSDGKRNGLSQCQTPCSPFPGLRRSAGKSPDNGGCMQQMTSGFPKSFKISSAVTLLMSSYRSMFSNSFDHFTLNTSCPRCSKAFPMLLVPANNSNTFIVPFW